MKKSSKKTFWDKTWCLKHKTKTLCVKNFEREWKNPLDLTLWILLLSIIGFKSVGFIICIIMWIGKCGFYCVSLVKNFEWEWRIFLLYLDFKFGFYCQECGFWGRILNENEEIPQLDLDLIMWVLLLLVTFFCIGQCKVYS